MPSAKTTHVVAELPGSRYSVVVLPVLLAIFWWPALWAGKVLLHYDAGYFSLPLAWLHGQALAGHDTLLWSNRIYGGHPIFAEGQGGFVDPLNILAIWLFSTTRALGFLHWATMCVGGVGVFVLGRILSISRWSATFAAIVTVFSGAWVFNQHDYPVMSTLAWMPWLLAAAEWWLLKPSLRRAVVMTIPAALLVFAGYPQVAHGALLYLLATLLVLPFNAEARTGLLRSGWHNLLVGGAAASLLAAALSAVQLLPLLELVGESSRSHGTATFDQPLFHPLYFQGLLYFRLGDSGQAFAQSLSSGMVVLLVGVALMTRLPLRLAGHLLGAFLLFNLGMGHSSPLFRAAYEFHLIPGLHFFRLFYTYFTVAVVGLSLVAAYSLDLLASEGFRVSLHGFLRKKIPLYSAVVLGGAGFLMLCVYLHVPEISFWNFFSLPLLVALAFLLVRHNRRLWLPLLAAMLFSVEILLLRSHALPFFDQSVSQPPQNLQAIIAERDREEFKLMDSTLAILMSTLAPDDPNLGRDFRRLLNAMTPFALAFHWQTPSINGVSGLHLARRDLLDSAFGAEILGGDSNRPGLRMIDILGVRYISRDTPESRPGLSLFSVDQPQDRFQHLFIYRNDYAKPRFQVYWNAEAVDKPEQALEGLKAARSEQLFVERRRGEIPPPTGGCATCAAVKPAVKPAVEVAEATAMRYRVKVDMPQEGWLFLADAYYPGWEATVNGTKRPVYAAQVLGKAVRLDAGRNEVTIRYVPRMFYIGAVVSAITLLCVILILWRGRRECQRQEIAEC